jgi:hypothetical protein
MKKLVTLTVGALLFAASGCTSTVSLGTKANETQLLGASAGEEGLSVTLPFVKAQIAPATATTTKE